MACQISGFINNFNQAFKNLKVDCLRTNRLFKDDKFPPSDKSLGYLFNTTGPVKWTRAKELISDAQLYLDSPLERDLNCFTFGDYGFKKAINMIAHIQEHKSKLIPDDQSFTTNYCGLFHFRIWQKGVWLDVCVDDFLPVDSNNQLIYLNDLNNKNELWICLLEKAYAKLFGCYSMVKRVKFEECLVDLTGGVNELIDLNRMIREQKKLATIRHNSSTVIRMINRAKRIGSVCLATMDQPITAESPRSSSCKIEKIISRVDEKANLIRFTDGKPDENFEIKLDEKENLTKNEENDQELNNEEDLNNRDGDVIEIGEFFESYNHLKLVHINLMHLKFITKIASKKSRWDYKQLFGKWPVAKTPPRSEEANLLNMPQHIVNLRKTEDQDRSMIVSLMAIDYNERKKQNKPLATISFYVFKLNRRRNINLTFSRQNFSYKELKLIGKSGDCSFNEREVCKRFIVTQGVYVIVPCNMNVANETPYLLRIFTENIKIANDSDDENDFDDDNDDDNEIEDFNFIDDLEPSSDENETDSDDEKHNNKAKKFIPNRNFLPRIKKK